MKDDRAEPGTQAYTLRRGTGHCSMQVDDIIKPGLTGRRFYMFGLCFTSKRKYAQSESYDWKI
jgi:hypothetical protein